MDYWKFCKNKVKININIDFGMSELISLDMQWNRNSCEKNTLNY